MFCVLIMVRYSLIMQDTETVSFGQNNNPLERLILSFGVGPIAECSGKTLLHKSGSTETAPFPGGLILRLL